MWAVMGDSDSGMDKHSDLAKLIPKIPYNMAFDENGSKVDKTLVWVHGYNVTGEAAEATFSEVFKRLYHQGFQGEFIGFTWYGTPPPKIPAPHYHQTVVNSFQAGKLLSDFLSKINTKLYLAGHSMGNMVIGNAVQNHLSAMSEYHYLHNANFNYEKYFAVDAAVALEAYGQVDPYYTIDGVKKAPMMMFDNNDAGASWLDYYEYEPTSGFFPTRRLLSSEWYTLFDEADPRSKLTWRNFFSSLDKSKMINLYSSTEEVLRTLENDNFVLDDGRLLNVTTYTWCKQEKFKGRRTDLLMDVSGASSDYCGWRYNDKYAERKSWWHIFKQQLTPSEAAQLTDTELINYPFFRGGGEGWFDGKGLAPLLGPITGTHEVNSDYEVAGITNLTPGEFVTSLVSVLHDFDNYDKFGKSPCHNYLTMREWLLAHAFPATTLPMGANPLSADGFSNNIDMSTMLISNKVQWPRLEKDKQGVFQPAWYHSDYKNIPYQFTFKFYEKIVTEMN